MSVIPQLVCLVMLKASKQHKKASLTGKLDQMVKILITNRIISQWKNPSTTFQLMDPRASCDVVISRRVKSDCLAAARCSSWSLVSYHLAEHV